MGFFGVVEFLIGLKSQKCKNHIKNPFLSKDKRGLALDGQLKAEDTNLASSTIIKKDIPKENMGVIVSYKIKVSTSIIEKRCKPLEVANYCCHCYFDYYYYLNFASAD